MGYQQKVLHSQQPPFFQKHNQTRSNSSSFSTRAYTKPRTRQLRDGEIIP